MRFSTMKFKKTALVCGAGGFIGGHLVEFLKQKGYLVRGVDIKRPEFRTLSSDEFLLLDLRDPDNCHRAFFQNRPFDGPFDEVYQLAANMGGMGFIHSAECDIMHDNILINTNMVKTATNLLTKKYFFSSSVCIYPDMKAGDSELSEEEAYPAMPDNEYGWEKLYSERLAMTFGRHSKMKVRVARFQNTYGPYGTYDGGREKAPAAICRKVAKAKDGGTIDVWGDGTAVRSYTYIDDLIEGIYLLMHSDIDTPVNIGNPEYISVNKLVELVTKAANKNIKINYVDGPVGVQSRNFSNKKIYSLGWKPSYSVEHGIAKLYKWIFEEIR